MSDTPIPDPVEESSPADLRAEFERQLFAGKVELAFTRAGIDTTGPAGQAMIEKYAGANVGSKELRDAALAAEKLTAVAKEWGLVKDATPPANETPAPDAPASASDPATPPVTPDEADAHRSSDTLANGGVAPDPEDSNAHPAEVGLAMAQKRLQEGGTEREAAAEYFDRVVDAGAKGDPRITDVTVPNIQPAHAG